MATWISSFFDNQNEVARDVYNEYVDALKLGSTSRLATQQILDGFAEQIEDAPENKSVVWMALAVTQWKYGRLEPRVKSKALKFIKAGGDVAFYPPKFQERRRKVLDRVRSHLESPQPPEKPVRVLKPAKPSKKAEKLWKPGQIVAFRRDSGRFVLLLTEGVEQHKYIGQIPYFVALKWEGSKIPNFEKIVKLGSANAVIGVHPNQKGEPIPWDRVQRLDLVRPVTGNVLIDRDGVFCEEGWNDCHWSELDDEL